MQSLTGSCLCGAVTFVVEPPYVMEHCYCSRCRKKTGTGRATALIVEPDQVSFTAGEDAVKRWYLPSAKSFGTSVCATCGSPVPHLTRGRSTILVPVGSVDSEIPVRPAAHGHWASRAAWVSLDESDVPVHES